jgi:four helix bundle protein
VKGGDPRRQKEVEMHDATNPNPPAATAAWLGAERLDVYRVALEFLSLASQLGHRAPAPLRDQLDRASASIVLNIAEGAGRMSGRDKARFYVIARGSATECAAVLDILANQGRLNALDHGRGRGLLMRVAQMLSRLRSRFAASSDRATRA